MLYTCVLKRTGTHLKIKNGLLTDNKYKCQLGNIIDCPNVVGN